MTAQNTEKSVQRTRILVSIAAIFLALGVIYLIYWMFWGRYSVTTDDAYVGGNSVQVMPHISGQVVAILADETDQVKKGDVLVKLDTIDAQIQLKKAETNLAVITRQVSQYYDNVDALKSNVKIKKDNLDKVNEDYKRRQGLVVNKTISAEDLSHSLVALNSARDELAQAEQQLSGAIKLAGDTDLYHHPQVEQAINNLRDAYLNWRRTTIYAPVSGYIAKRAVQVGEQVNPKMALMVIVPLNQVWVEANFKESQLKHIRIGQPVEMIADAYGSDIEFNGKVIGINPGTGSSFDLLPPQNATGNWIKIVQRLPVRIGIDEDQLKHHPLRIGLSMTVTIDTHKRNGASNKNQDTTKVIYESIDYTSDLNEAEKLIESILKANSNNTEPVKM
ncbi:MAG: efflux RND transporter periplasmic adaptor subunit [Candidatus Berkiella sp.]